MIATFTLPRRLDSSAAPPLRQSLTDFQGQPLCIDAAEVEMIGARAFEVIIAAGRQWQADNQPLTIVDMSEAYRQAATTLGLDAGAPWSHASANGAAA